MGYWCDLLYGISLMKRKYHQIFETFGGNYLECWMRSKLGTWIQRQKESKAVKISSKNAFITLCSDEFLSISSQQPVAKWPRWCDDTTKTKPCSKNWPVFRVLLILLHLMYLFKDAIKSWEKHFRVHFISRAKINALQKKRCNFWCEVCQIKHTITV